MERTDKSSCIGMSWDYLRHYEAALATLRDAPINLIEIGVQNGASTRVWKWFFSQAQIIGIDINPGCARWAQERVKIEIGSQTDGEFLDRVCAENPPTVIVDDGSHVGEHMIFTFQRIFPHLAPGGVYIVEDFGYRYEKPAESKVENPDVSEYFMELTRCCHAGRHLRSNFKIPRAIIDQVDEVTFIKHAAIIRKAHTTRDVARAITTAQSYIETHELPRAAHDRLAAYLVRHGGPAEMAENILKDSIDAEDASILRLLLRAENLVRGGDLAAAAEIVRQAANCPPGYHLQMARMAKLQETLGDFEGALKSAQTALAQRPKTYIRLVKHMEEALAAHQAGTPG
jgi:hypothetical protein